MKNLKFIALLLKFNKNEEYAELYGAENKIFIQAVDVGCICTYLGRYINSQNSI